MAVKLVDPQPHISLPKDNSISGYLEPQSDFSFSSLNRFAWRNLHFIIFMFCPFGSGTCFREQNKRQRAAVGKRAENSLCSESRECHLAETISCPGLERMHASQKDVVGLPLQPSQAENGSYHSTGT